eukprot:7377250-Prymnesium_polylepis.1
MPIRCEPMGCALGHGSSSFLRIGAICGVPDASCDLSFDVCHQRLHRGARRTTSTGVNGPRSVILRRVLRDYIDAAGIGVRIARKRPRGQKRPLLPPHGRRGHCEPGPAIGFEGEGMARRGAISAGPGPRAPYLTT